MEDSRITKRQLSNQLYWSRLLLTSRRNGVSSSCQSNLYFQFSYMCQNNVPGGAPWVVKHICYSKIQAFTLQNTWKYNVISASAASLRRRTEKETSRGCHPRPFSPWPGLLEFLCALYIAVPQRRVIWSRAHWLIGWRTNAELKEERT